MTLYLIILYQYVCHEYHLPEKKNKSKLKKKYKTKQLGTKFKRVSETPRTSAYLVELGTSEEIHKRFPSFV